MIRYDIGRYSSKSYLPCLELENILFYFYLSPLLSLHLVDTHLGVALWQRQGRTTFWLVFPKI